MKKRFSLKTLVALAISVLLIAGMAVFAFASDGETATAKMIDCSSCEGSGYLSFCAECEGTNLACKDCSAVSNVCGDCSGSGKVEAPTRFYSSPWALLPPVIAIALALITKEVYSSLFVGIVVGGLLYAEGNFEGTVTHVFSDGFVANIADSYNMGIIIFLIVLGSMVAMMNKAGGSAAFGRWAKTHIKSRVGAQLATVLFGCMIFIDDYFNCLTVGSVMRPVTDSHKVSRAKLAYLIDATAAPICIIAPVSSWAAAVAGFVAEEEVSGFQLFLNAIPYNFYAILTIIMMVAITVMKFDYGKMRIHEQNALNGDLFTSDAESFKDSADTENANPKGKVIDLIIPVVLLIIACVIGLIYSGGFFDAESGTYHNIIEAFSSADASVGLLYGSFDGDEVLPVLVSHSRIIESLVHFLAEVDFTPDGFLPHHVGFSHCWERHRCFCACRIFDVKSVGMGLVDEILCRCFWCKEQ